MSSSENQFQSESHLVVLATMHYPYGRYLLDCEVSDSTFDNVIQRVSPRNSIGYHLYKNEDGKPRVFMIEIGEGVYKPIIRVDFFSNKL